ncbi:MAG TPA: hypothetical protein VGF99_05255 [Myxococcota bacterium]
MFVSIVAVVVAVVVVVVIVVIIVIAVVGFVAFVIIAAAITIAIAQPGSSLGAGRQDRQNHGTAERYVLQLHVIPPAAVSPDIAVAATMSHCSTIESRHPGCASMSASRPSTSS